jgi:hypothetical protein
LKGSRAKEPSPDKITGALTTFSLLAFILYPKNDVKWSKNRQAITLSLRFLGIYEMDFLKGTNINAPGGFYYPLGASFNYCINESKCIFSSQIKT